MNIIEDTYNITYENNIIQISGKLSLMLEDYNKIEDFFMKILENAQNSITLDIRNLEFLNSSGIKTICVSLILEASEIEGLHLKILCSNKYTWQKETIPTFKDLMDNMEIIF